MKISASQSQTYQFHRLEILAGLLLTKPKPFFKERAINNRRVKFQRRYVEVTHIISSTHLHSADRYHSCGDGRDATTKQPISSAAGKQTPACSLPRTDGQTDPHTVQIIRVAHCYSSFHWHADKPLHMPATMASAEDWRAPTGSSSLWQKFCCLDLQWATLELAPHHHLITGERNRRAGSTQGLMHPLKAWGWHRTKEPCPQWEKLHHFQQQYQLYSTNANSISAKYKLQIDIIDAGTSIFLTLNTLRNCMKDAFL